MRPKPSLIPRGLCFLNVDDMWDLFESLASYLWQCECACESFVYPSLPPYDLHAQSPCRNSGDFQTLN